jgi:DNA-nicking Smr family endonuclease
MRERKRVHRAEDVFDLQARRRMGHRRQSCEINYRLWQSYRAGRSDLERLRRGNVRPHARIDLFSFLGMHATRTGNVFLGNMLRAALITQRETSRILAAA